MRIRTKRKEHEVKVKWQGKKWPFTVLPMDVEQENEIRKNHTTHELIKGQLIPDTDFIGMKIEKVQKVIRSWPCTDDNDQLIECNSDNKKDAYLLNPDLINLVLEEAGKIAAGIAEVKEEEKKTSDNG